MLLEWWFVNFRMRLLSKHKSGIKGRLVCISHMLHIYGIFITVYLYEWPVMQLNPGWSIPIKKKKSRIPMIDTKKNTVNLGCLQRYLKISTDSSLPSLHSAPTFCVLLMFCDSMEGCDDLKSGCELTDPKLSTGSIQNNKQFADYPLIN
jgi:hypothetical protein